MTTQKPSRTLEHALRQDANSRLLMHADGFTRSAQEYNGLAEMFSNAAQDMRLLQEEVRRLATENSALKTKLAVSNFKTKPKRVFLLDGSNSMSIKESLNRPTRTEVALDALQEFAGAKDKVIIFGDDNPPEISMKDQAALTRVRSGLNTATNLLPALEKAATNLEKGFAHLVIMGDGDFSDFTQSLKKIQSMTAVNPKLVVSVLTIDYGWNSQLQHLGQFLSYQKCQTFFRWSSRNDAATATKEMLASANETALLRMAEINTALKAKAATPPASKP